VRAQLPVCKTTGKNTGDLVETSRERIKDGSLQLGVRGFALHDLERVVAANAAPRDARRAQVVEGDRLALASARARRCSTAPPSARSSPLVEVLRCRSIFATKSRQPPLLETAHEKDVRALVVGFRPGRSAHDALAVLSDSRKRPKRKP
jgi:hypothetical protein